MLHIKDILLVNNNFLLENLTARSFFDAKKLIIIDQIPLSSSEKSSDLKSRQDFIESLLDKIPDENIVVFSSINPDKRSKFYKLLRNSAEIKEFNSQSSDELKQILLNKF